jgi:TRAP-type transport system periplasmic protein
MKVTRRVVGQGMAAVTAASIITGKGFAQSEAMKLGTAFPPTHPASIRMVEACAAIKKESNGAVNIEVFPNSMLGSENAMQSQVRSGALEFMTTSGVVLQGLSVAAGINGVAFVFKDYPEVWKAMDGDLGAYIRAAGDKVGLFIFEKTLDNGYRNITTSNHPINTVSDLKGLKIRVPPTPLWVSMFAALGASPTSIGLNELYSSLQTKIVDAQENPLVQIETVKVYEVQKYCSMTGHVWDGNWIVANKKSWAALPDDSKKLVAKHFDAGAIKQREDVERLNTDLETTLAQKGLTFNHPEKGQFRDALEKAGFYTEWKKKFGPEAWSKLEQYAGKLGA